MQQENRLQVKESGAQCQAALGSCQHHSCRKMGSPRSKERDAECGGLCIPKTKCARLVSLEKFCFSINRSVFIRLKFLTYLPKFSSFFGKKKKTKFPYSFVCGVLGIHALPLSSRRGNATGKTPPKSEGCC